MRRSGNTAARTVGIDMARKSGYRLGRKLRASARDRLDYITYLHSGGDPTQGRVPEPKPDFPGRLIGKIVLTDAIAGKLKITNLLRGVVDIGGSLQGFIFPPAALRGKISIESQLVGSLKVANQLRGRVDGFGQIQGRIAPAGLLSGRIQSNTDSITGRLRVNKSLRGQIDGQGLITGRVFPPAALKGRISITDDLRGNYVVGRRIRGQITGSDSIRGNLTKVLPKTFAGLVNGDGSLTGKLTVSTPTAPLTVLRTLIVAGGGAGAGAGNATTGAPGGGGGGGQVIALDTPFNLTPGAYPVVVGSGGVAGVATAIPTAGGNSSFNGQTAIGGGRGGNASAVATNGGGGRAGKNGAGALAGVINTEGFTGGFGSNASPYGNGGGGAGNTNNGGSGSGTSSGGAGLTNDIYPGAARVYGNGGVGGRAAAGSAGAFTSGNGGGGGGQTSGTTFFAGANGGSGFVVIRYTGPAKATGGTIITDGADTVHYFTADGTFTVLSQQTLKGAVAGDGTLRGNPTIDKTKKLKGVVTVDGSVKGNVSIPSTSDIAYAQWESKLGANTKPTAPRVALIKKTIADLMTAGIWSKLHNLYLFAAQTEIQASFSIAPMTSWTAVQDYVGSATFTADKGWKGGQVRLGPDYNEAAGKYKAASGTIFARIIDTGLAAGYIGFLNASYRSMLQFEAAGSVSAKINIPFGDTGAAAATGLTDFNHTISASRRANNDMEIYVDGVSQATDTTVYASMGVPNNSDMGLNSGIYANTVWGPMPKNVGVVGYAAGLTDSEHAALATIIEYYVANL